MHIGPNWGVSAGQGPPRRKGKVKVRLSRNNIVRVVHTNVVQYTKQYNLVPAKTGA